MMQSKRVRGAFKGFVGLFFFSATFGIQGCKKAVFKDAEKKTSSSLSASNPITVPITCYITSVLPYWRNVTNELISYSCTQNAGGTLSLRECQLDANPWVPCDSFNSHALSGLTEGIHAFRVRATDTEIPAHIGQSNDLIWSVDTIAPTFTGGGAQLISQSIGNATFTFSGQDNVGGSGVQKFQCRLPNLYNTWADCNSPKVYGGMTGNTGYTFQTQVIDFAGNVSAPSEISFTSNPTVANGSCVIGAFPTPIKVRTQVASFTCSSPNPISAYECRVNQGAWVNCLSSTSHTMTNLPDGEDEFEVRFKDSLGTPSLSTTKTFFVDTLAPTVAITDTNVSSLTPSFSFEGTDPGGSGIKEYRCKLAEGANIISDWALCSSPTFYSSGIAPGKSYAFLVKAFDNADNESAPATYSWFSAPDHAPSCVILTSYPVAPSGSAFRNHSSETITFACSSSDPTLTTECRLNNGSWVTCQTGSTHQLNGLTSGSLYNFDVRARDSFGNQGTPSSVLSWRVDLVAPTVSVLPIESDNPTAKASFSGADLGGSGIQKVECAIDGVSAYANCTSPLTISNLTLNQSYTFRARATDWAGNVGPETVQAWTSVPGIPGPTCMMAFNPTPPLWTNQLLQNFNINCTGPDTLSGIDMSRDSAAWDRIFNFSPAAVMPKTVAVVAQSTMSGTKTLYSRGINSLQKTGTSDVKSWNVDVLSPVAVVNQVVVDSTGTHVSFSATDTGGSGVLERWCQLDGQSPYAICTSPVNYLGKGNVLGTSNVFRVKAKDGAGNWSTETTYSWSNATNGGWGSWSNCSASCDGGTQSRTCAQPSPDFLFSNCTAGTTDIQTCNTQACCSYQPKSASTGTKGVDQGSMSWSQSALNFSLTQSATVNFNFASDVLETNLGNNFGWAKTCISIDGQNYPNNTCYEDSAIDWCPTTQVTANLAAGAHTASLYLCGGQISRLERTFINASWNGGQTVGQSCNVIYPSGKLLCSGCGDPPNQPNGLLSPEDCDNSPHTYNDPTDNWHCGTHKITLRDPHSYQTKGAGLQCGVGGNPPGNGKNYQEWDVYCY